MKKKNKIFFIILLIIVIFMSSAATYAAVKIQSKDVLYDNSKSLMNTSTVKEALDELYSKCYENYDSRTKVKVYYHHHVDNTGTERNTTYHASASGGCFTKAVYKVHKHSDGWGWVVTDQRDNRQYWKYSGGCYTNKVEYVSEVDKAYPCVWDNDTYSCTSEHDCDCGPYGAGMTHYHDVVDEAYGLGCGKKEGTRYSSEGVEYYEFNCTRKEDSVERVEVTIDGVTTVYNY